MHVGTLASTANLLLSLAPVAATIWSKSAKTNGLYEGRDRECGALRWTATPVDLAFGSNSELRAVSEVYASDDGQQLFADDFVKAWVLVMNRDRS